MNWIKNTHRSVSAIAGNKKKQQQFLWLISFILLLFFGYLWYKHQINYNLLIAAGILFLLSFTLAQLSRPFLYIWMYFGRVLSEVTSFVILTIIFFIFIVPMGIFYRKAMPSGWKKTKGSSNFNEQF